MAQITTDQLPDYNGWSKEDWIEFHHLLKQKFGRISANKVWSEFFNNKPTGWTRDQVYTADPAFKSYFKSQGIKFDSNFYSELDSVTGMIGSYISALPTAIKIGGAVIIVSAVGLIGFGLYRGFRNLQSTHRSLEAGKKKILENPEILAKALL